MCYVGQHASLLQRGDDYVTTTGRLGNNKKQKIINTYWRRPLLFTYYNICVRWSEFPPPRIPLPLNPPLYFLGGFVGGGAAKGLLYWGASDLYGVGVRPMWLFFFPKNI